MPFLPPGRSGANNPSVGSTIEPESRKHSYPLNELDEYGTELHRAARVWKVYVKETDKYDEDLVKGWNDSVDVILVFAALFSAISSAFLIESSKTLQQDPLSVISQTLLLIANGTQSPGSMSPRSADFTPSRTAVWTNTLWYLSLSLSLATSFIAILAKDWCHSFMKDRTGHPFDQACRRQKKWDMLVRWRVSELLGFLPSLMHVALLLFAVGLCITLWDTHVAVAVPVICVSGVAFGFYISSSIAASVMDSFPYPTIFSRMFRSKPRQFLWQLFCELPFLFGLVLNSVAMVLFVVLFSPVETITFSIGRFQERRYRNAPRSFRPQRFTMILHFIAFLVREVHRGYRWARQKIADTVFNGPRWFLSRIPTILQGFNGIWKRINPKSRLKNSNTIHEGNDLPSRGLSWLIRYCEVPESVDIALQSIAGATSRVSRSPLLDCKATSQILRRLVSANLYRNPNANSDVVVSLYVRALSFLGTSANSNLANGRKQVSELGASIWDLEMETETKVAALIEEGHFEPTQSNLEALRIGSTVAPKTLKLLQTELGSSDIVLMLESIAKLLRSHAELHDAAVLSLTYAATLLMLVVPVSIAKRLNDEDLPPELLTIRRNYTASSGERDSVDAHPLLLECIKLSKHHPSGLIASLATTCVLLYHTREDSTRPGVWTWSEEVVSELIERYSQDEEVLNRIYKIPPPGIGTAEDPYDLKNYFSRLSNNFMPNTRINSMAPRLGGSNGREVPEYKIAAAELHALLSVCRLTPIASLSPTIYVLVVEFICCSPSPSLLACGSQILSKCPFPSLSDELIAELERRDLILLLKTTSASNDQTKSYFAKGQLWLLLSLYIYAQDTEEGRDELKAQLDKCRKNGDQSEVDRLFELGQELCRALHRGCPMIHDLGIWAYRLDECTSQLLSEPYHYGNEIAGVPSELRALSSFTAWPQQAGNPSTNKPRPVEQAEAETKGEDAGRADSSQDIETATQGPPAGDGKCLADVNSREEVGEVWGEGNSGVAAVGDEPNMVDAIDATRTSGVPQPEGEEAENEGGDSLKEIRVMP